MKWLDKFCVFVGVANKAHSTPNKDAAMLELARELQKLLKSEDSGLHLKEVADAELDAVIGILQKFYWIKDKESALHRVLCHLESAFSLYTKYEESLLNNTVACIAYRLNSAMSSNNHFVNICTAKAHICYLMAGIHKVLGDKDYLVESWIGKAKPSRRIKRYLPSPKWEVPYRLQREANKLLLPVKK